MIWAVVLAAGESRRMGTQKLLLPYGKQTVVEAVVSTAEASRVDRVMIVLGSDKSEVRRAVERGAAREGGVVFTVNAGYRSGMLSSIQAGFRALPEDAEAAVVMLGDQPFLPARVVDAVVGAYRESGRGIVVPVYEDRRGHPLLVDMKHRAEVLRLDPAVGLRQLLRAHVEDVLEVEVGEASILRDLDTPQDYQDGVKPTFCSKR